MNYKNKFLKKTLDRMKSGKSRNPEDRNNKNLSIISGMKGAEKKLKDRIGKSLNNKDNNDIIDKINKKIASSINPYKEKN